MPPSFLLQESIVKKTPDLTGRKTCTLRAWTYTANQRCCFTLYFVVCRLYPFSPSHHGIVRVLPVISLHILLTNTVSPVQACLIIYDGKGFRGTQKGDDRGPFSIQSSLLKSVNAALKRKENLFLIIFPFGKLSKLKSAAHHSLILSRDFKGPPNGAFILQYIHYILSCVLRRGYRADISTPSK